MTNIGAFIQYYRTKSGFTQKELANGICSISYLSKIENGTIEPSHDVIMSLCDKLNAPYEDLISVENEDLNDDIYNLYKLIAKKNFNEAKSSYSHLKSMITPFHQLQTLHFFRLIEFYYLIETKQEDAMNQPIEQIHSMKESFTGEALYLFNKIFGVYYIHCAYPNKAITYFKDAEKVLVEYSLKDPDLYYLLAATYTRMEEPVLSNHYCQIAKEQFISEFFYPKITDCYVLFGINYILLKEFELSKQYLFQILDSRPMMDSELVTANLKHNIGFMYCEMREWEKAIPYLEDAIHSFKSYYEKLHSYHLIAKAHYYLQEIEQSASYIEQGEVLSKRINDVKLKCQLEILKAQVNDEVGESSFVEKAENKWIPYLTEVGERHTLKELYRILAESLKEKEQYKLSSYYFQELAKQSI
ncbi:helix-turn-helix domain-containing protein [Alkalibacillus haloalkaliphilus]|uniref:helix-turn-helix domain-containing protein n=1 Tax=Alkalibacillus haloalkaliphilus TaxID=94136 RepID=UPI0003147D53|nr:helix-turn-helix domain-containing protein [Alkalibacillus haloalkaliphilus]